MMSEEITVSEMFGNPWKVEGTFRTYDAAKNTAQSLQIVYGSIMNLKIKQRSDGFRVYSRENVDLTTATKEVEAKVKATRSSNKGKKV
jgi:hypothetical protein